MIGQNTVEIVVRLDAEQFKAGAAQVQSALNGIPPAVLRLARQAAALEQSQLRAARAASEQAKTLHDVERASSNATRAKVQLEQANVKLTIEEARLAQAQEKVITETIRQQKAMADAAAASSRADAAALRLEQAQRRVANATSSAGNHWRAYKKHLESVSSVAQGIGVTLSAAISAPLILTGKSAAEAAQKYEAARLKLESVTGSAKEAAKQFEALQKLAKLPAVDLAGAVSDAAKLQASGFSFQRSQALIRNISNIVARGGGGNEDTSEILRQLSQLQGKGKFSQADFNVILERAPELGKLIRQEFGGATAEALRDAGVSVEQFISKLEKLTPEKVGLAKLSFRERFENIRQDIERALVPIGEVIVKNVLPAIEKLTPTIIELGNSFAALPASTQNTILVLTGIVAAAGPAVLLLGSLAGSLASLVGLFGAFSGATVVAEGVAAVGTAAVATEVGVTGLGAALAALGGPLTLAVVGAGLLATGLYALANAQQSYESASLGTIQSQAEQVQSAAALVKEVEGLGGAMFVTRAEQEKLKAAYDALSPVAQERIRAMSDESKIAGQLAQELAAVRDKSRIEIEFEGAKALAEFNNLRQQIDLTTKAIESNEKQFAEAFRNNDTQALNGIAETLKLNREEMKKFGEQAETAKLKIQAVTSATGLSVRDLAITAQVKGLIQDYHSVADAAEAAIPAVRKAAAEVGKQSTGALKDAINIKEIFTAGQQIPNGLVSGMESRKDAVALKAAELGAVASQATRNALQIKSPSKVFHQIGVNIGEGLTLGIKSTAARVRGAINDLVRETRETAEKAALFDVPGFVQAKTRQEVVGQIAATKQAQFDVSLFGNADFFAAKNAALDAENLKRLAEEVFELQRGLKELSNIPIPPALKALPTDEAGLKAIKDYDERLKALNEAVQKVKDGQIALNLSVKEFGETMGPIPDVIRQANEELSATIDASQKAIAAYDKIKQGLEGVIDGASDAISGLTRSQKIAREIANLPADFDPTKRAELERLASQAQVAEQQQLALEKSRRIAEAITGTFNQAFRDGFERGPKAFFARIFEAGKETFSRLAASALATLTTNLLGGFLQKLTSIFRAPGQSTGGGFGGILGSLGGLFGGGGSSGGGFGSIINSTFGGGSLGGGVFSLLGGGGRSLLPVGTSSLAGLALPTQLPTFISTGGAAANQALATATAAQSGGVLRGGLGSLFSLAGLKNAFKGIGFGLPQGSAVGSLGQALPLLGLTLGASLGGQSKLGQITGAIGGGLLGIGLTAAPAALGTTGIGGALAGLFSNPITAVIGGALLVGSYFLGRAKQRKADEKLVDTYWVEYMETLKRLTKDVNANRIDGDSAMQQALAARAEAIGLISQIKTKSVRESRLAHQIPDVDRLFLGPLKDAIERQKARGANVQRIVPEFAMGGHVDRVLRAASGLRGRVAAGRGWPHDDVAVRVSRDEAILNPIQIARLGAMMGTSGEHVLKAAGVPGYATGRMPSDLNLVAASGQPIILNLEIESRAIIGPADAETITIRGLTTDKGQRVMVGRIKQARNNGDL